MQRLFIMYRLKEGARMPDFSKYSRDKDQPTVNKQEGVKSFEVYEIVGADKGKPEFDVVEDILVESYEKWIEVTNREVMKKNIAEWGNHCDGSSARVLIGRKIE